MGSATEAIHGFRARLVDSPASLGGQARAARWERFVSTFPDLGEMSVLDLGGRMETWRRAPLHPAHVHVVNFERADGPVPEWAEFDTGDACDLPPAVRSRRYDLVFSNSVIEHVGGYAQRRRFAESVHTAADRHWVQTPYRYFPVEPHFLFPGFQFLPLPARASVIQRWPLLHTPTDDRAKALRKALNVELLGRTELQALFPESAIVAEKMMGLVKSLVAVKTA